MLVSWKGMVKTMKKKITVKEMAMIGVMAAAVYVSSAFMQIPISTAIDNTRLHMGNVMCLLAGLLLGPWQGGLASGIGSMLFDLTNPAYISSAPFTFAFKFLMAWLCGKIAASQKIGKSKRFVISALSGSLLYVILYLSKSFVEYYFILNLPLQAVKLTISQKAVVSCVNAIVAVCVAVPLGLVLCPVIRKYIT